MLPKNKPKRQHFLPKMFLEGFTNSNGHILMLDKHKGKIEVRNPTSAARLTHLYTIHKKGAPLFHVEELFSRIETDMAPLVLKIRELGFQTLNNQELQYLVEFIIITFNRTPLATKAAEDALKDKNLINELGDKGDGAKEYLETLSNNKGLSFAVTLQSHLEYRFNIIRRNFDAFLLTSPSSAPSFIINDSYLNIEQRIGGINFTAGQPVEWGKLNVNMHFPISNHQCLALGRVIN